MRRKLLLWIAPWIALGLGACATAPRVGTSEPCAEWRWIAIRGAEESKCPDDVPGWKVEPLFPTPPVAEARTADYKGEKVPSAAPTPAPEVLDQLERFCVYETHERAGKLPPPPTANGKLVRVDRDCAAVSVSGNTAWHPFSDRFMEQAGKPDTALDIQNVRGVRLAFLDTQPTGEPFPTRPTDEWASEHGYTLAHMARNLICSPDDGARCAALITTRMALPIQQWDSRSWRGTKISPERGGQIGTQLDLARAIREEVDAWRKDLGRPDAPQHLVLNLSVGWDGRLFSGFQEQAAEMNAGTQAVYWALRYARDLDVLVLAAAGNACNGPSEGPLLPAAWEQEAPEEGTCGEPAERPLVYAVGGVDRWGRALMNARRGGMPGRAAYGEDGVVPALFAPGDSTNMYTGTSVSTAIVASIAAIVWDTLPDRSSRQIMEILHRSGNNLSAIHADLRASFWFGAGMAGRSTPPPVRRLSLCSALAEACREPGALNCPLRSECDPWVPDPSAPQARLSAPPLRTCHPWVHTQPPTEPCPVCEPPRN